MRRDINDLDLNSTLKKREQEDSYRFTNTTLNQTESSGFVSTLYSSEKFSASDEDCENENPDEPRGVKRKNSSNEYVNHEKCKILKKESDPEPVNVTRTIPLTPVTPSAKNDYFVTENTTILRTKTLTKDYFSLLPDEVLLFIFKTIQFKPALVNCACVCRRWKSVAFDPNLWFRIDISQRRIESGIMEDVLTKKPIILRMSQTKVISPIFKNIDTATKMLSKIEYLDLSMASISPSDLEIILRTCHNLVKLSLESVGVSEGVCKEIAKNSKLTVLDLAQASNLNDTSLKVILTNCSKLNELNVAWTSLDTAAIKCVCQYVPKDIARLNLSGCVKEMSDSHVGALALRCNKLKELDISDATGITDSSIHAICDNLNNLEILSLSRCYNIYPASYSKLFRLPSIAHINIFGLFSESQIETLRKTTNVELNKMKFSYIARPTVGNRRTSVWGLRVRD